MKNPEFWLAAELGVLFLKTRLANHPDAQSCSIWQLIIKFYTFLQIRYIFWGSKFYIPAGPEIFF